MVEALQEFEGTWEELAEHAEEFNGRRLRVVVLPEPEPAGEGDGLTIEEKIAALFADVPESEWAKLPPDLTDNLDHYIYGTPKH
ncbi:MAG TPA: hypothetical protein VGM51_00195 [Armatimonadota bacterium]|jgi:hypothetical protein